MDDDDERVTVGRLGFEIFAFAGCQFYHFAVLGLSVRDRLAPFNFHFFIEDRGHQSSRVQLAYVRNPHLARAHLIFLAL